MKNLLYLMLMIMVSSCCQPKYLYDKKYFVGKANFELRTDRPTGLVTRINSTGNSDDGSFLCKISEIEKITEIEFGDKIYFRLIKKDDFVYATDITKNSQINPYQLRIDDDFGRFYLHQLYTHFEDPNHNKFHRFMKLNSINCANLVAGKILNANGDPKSQLIYHMTLEEAEYYQDPPPNTGPFYFETEDINCTGNIKKMLNFSSTHNHPGH